MKGILISAVIPLCLLHGCTNKINRISQISPSSSSDTSRSSYSAQTYFAGFKEVALPYQSDAPSRFETKKDDASLRTLLHTCNHLPIDLSDVDRWAWADLGEDSLAVKHLAEDTSEVISPAFLLFKDANIVVASFVTAHSGHEVLFTTDNRGRCINAVTVGYYLGNINGYVERKFSLETDLSLHVFEQGEIRQDSSRYSVQADFVILSDGRIEPR